MNRDIDNPVPVPVTVVAAAVMVRDGLILAGRRPPGRPLAGKWEFPGGKVEAGETPENALARELEEELGIKVWVFDRVYELEVAGAERILRLCFIRAGLTPESAEPQGCEGQEWGWFAPDELMKLDFLEPDRPVVCFLAAR